MAKVFLIKMVTSHSYPSSYSRNREQKNTYVAFKIEINRYER